VVEGSEPIQAGSGWPKSLLAVAAFMVILAVAATAVVMTVGGPKESTYPAGSPEAAFQSFLKAAKSGDWTTADGLLSSGLQAQGVTAQQAAGPATLDLVTVSIKSSSTTGTVATLSLDVQTSSGSGLGSFSYHSVSTVRMVLEGDRWKLDSQVGSGY
jgi:hypothetical protein